ncbi:hypothetical protein GCM10010446_60790 [Streptomyces enissocaesilis]|uniref:Uncharacterized protein n=1 Tax=Streptomyces enissocaesilis TaxID=332589 RepID=A0ABN3XNZ9_9ACTN
MFDEVLAVPAVDPHLADAGVVGGNLVEQRGAGDGVLHAVAVTSTARRRPSVSVTMLRLRPTVFFPASTPWPAAGTLVEVFTLWASITQADGSPRRPSFSRSSCLSRPPGRANTPSSAHLAK